VLDALVDGHLVDGADLALVTAVPDVDAAMAALGRRLSG